MPPQPSSASDFSSWTTAFTLVLPRPLPAAAAASLTASAKPGGRRSPGGVLTQSRVVVTAVASTWAVSNASLTSDLRAEGLSTVTVPGAVSSVGFL